MPPFRLACLAYLIIALPGSVLGILWPSMRLSLHQPVGALGILLVLGTLASVISSVVTGHVLARVPAGGLLAAGLGLSGLALAVEAISPSMWIVAIGFGIGGLGFGALDSGLNAYAAWYFGPRQVNWMHASYGLGATVGPLVVAALLSHSVGWRSTYGVFAVGLSVLALVFFVVRHRWQAQPKGDATRPDPNPEQRVGTARRSSGRRLAVVGSVVITAVESGIESGAGVWGFLFLTGGRGLSDAAGGVALAAYWAMMFLGRVALGPVAERVGAGRVLALGIVGVAVGAAIMAWPGPAWVAVVGLMFLGLAAAPIFPLLTLTTGERLGVVDSDATTRGVGLPVAADAAGSSILAAGMGAVIGAATASALGPSLLTLAVAMCGLYAVLSRLSRRLRPQAAP